MVMIRMLFYPLICSLFFGCAQNDSHAQNEKATNKAPLVGGRCEGCEAVYETDVPFEALNEVDTLPIFDEAGPKLVISGTVYKSDGKTPAPGVVIYIYHTDQQGQYRVSGNESGWAKRHGSIRGWMKTNAAGQYKFYTVRPASYSQIGPAAHIHVTIKEPDKNEYWIDEFLFEDDPFLTAQEKSHHQNRGGNGILKLKRVDGVQYAERNIYLGKNIPGYPGN